MYCLGLMYSGEDPSKAELEDMVREVDHDGDGKIDLLEFCRAMTTKLRRPAQDSRPRDPATPRIRQPTGGGRRAKEEGDSHAKPTSTMAGGPIDSKGNRIHIKQPTAKRARAKVRQAQDAQENDA